MKKTIIVLYMAVLSAVLIEYNAFASDARLRSNRPGNVNAVTRMEFLRSREMPALYPDVPRLIDPRKNTGDLLDVQAENGSPDPADLSGVRWSFWSEWSDCSRSCGGGVSSRTRKCMSRFSVNIVDLGCDGSSVDNKLCNTEMCPPRSPSFREAQCSLHNDDAYLSRKFEWIPFSGKDGNSCDLSCVAKNFHFYNSFGTAQDGTRCGYGGKGVCVKAECITIGCDGNIGSNLANDMCGVCGGRNETCFRRQNVVDRLPRRLDLTSGYNAVAEIPAGATNTLVKDYNRNYLALSEVDGDDESYVINGNWIISYPGEYKTAGTTVTYDRVKDKETLRIEGPTKKMLRVMVLSLGEQPLVEYEYWLPNSKQLNGRSEFRMQQKAIIEAPSEDDYRNQILAAGFHLEDVALPTLSSTTAKVTSTAATTTLKTEAPADTQTEIRRPTARPPQCIPCKKTVNKKKHFCDSDFAVHVRVLPRRRLQRGRFVRYEVEILSSYKPNVRMMRREYVWMSSACCSRLRPYRHYLLMGRSTKRTSESHSQELDLEPGKSFRSLETRLLVDHAEFWHTWRKYQIRMSRAAKHINCKRYRYLAKFYRRKHNEG